MKMSIAPCLFCGKPTNSHVIGNVRFCHSCYQENDEEVEQIKEIGEDMRLSVAREELAQKIIAMSKEGEISFEDEIDLDFLDEMEEIKEEE